MSEEENQKNRELSDMEQRCLALGSYPKLVFRGKDNQYRSAQEVLEIMRQVEQNGRELEQLAKAFQKKYS